MRRLPGRLSVLVLENITILPDSDEELIDAHGSIDSDLSPCVKPSYMQTHVSHKTVAT